MKVKELIEELSKYDGDIEVYHKIGLKVDKVAPAPLNYLYDKPEDRIVILY